MIKKMVKQNMNCMEKMYSKKDDTRKPIVQLTLEEFWVNNAFASLEYIREHTKKSVPFAFTEEFDDKFIEFRFVEYYRPYIEFIQSKLGMIITR